MVAIKVLFIWALVTVTSRSLGANVENRVTLGERPNDSWSQLSRGPNASKGQLSLGNDSDVSVVTVEPWVDLADFVINSGDGDVYTKKWDDTVDLGVKDFAKRLQCVQQGFSGWVCAQCLNPSVVKNTVATGAERNKPHIYMYEIEQLSVFLLNHALVFRDVCSKWKVNKTGENCKPYQVCEDQLRKALPLDDSVAGNPERLLEIVENVLREVKGFYEPDPSKNCFSAERILSELHAVNVTLQKLAGKIVAHMLKGECVDVGEAITDFMDDIFLHYGDRCNGVITPTAFEKLMSDLKTQGAEEHENHEVSINACDKDVEINGEPRSTTQNYHSSEQYDLDGISKDDREKNSYTTRDLNTRRTRSTAPLSSKTAEHEHRSLANKCLSAEGLLQKFIMNSSENITPNDFLQLCPALVQQVVSGVCTNAADSNTRKVKIKKTSTTESYLYGCLAVFLISLTSVSGALAIPILNHRSFKFVMMLFIGISFGTMTGDAILHLIPQALGLHGHDEEESIGEKHVGVSFENIPEYIGIQACILIVLYSLFLFESTSALLFGNAEAGHGHSHIPNEITVGIPNHTSTPQNETGNSDSSDVQDTYQSNHMQSVDQSPRMAGHGSSHIPDKLPVSIPMKIMDNHISTLKKETSDSDSSDMQGSHHSNHVQSTDGIPHMAGHGSSHIPDKLPVSIPMKSMDNHISTPEKETNDSHSIDIQERYHSNHVQSTDELHHMSGVVTVPSNDALVGNEPEALIKSTRLFYGFTTMAIAIIIGDIMHNFADGIALGAAFVPGLKGGISTSLAVLCHELPHELGDFAILMSTGLSYKQALTMNFLSALTSFAGFFLGIEYGADLSTRKWIMSATAGVFLYVALAEMIPDLKAKDEEDAVSTYFIKNAGVIIGFVIMIIIAIFEEHFHI